ncbi:hypothetical protein QTP88_029037 [Uroleucon formosanum]
MSNKVQFRVKIDTPLIPLESSYYSKLDLQEKELHFLYDDHRITDDETPRKLDV